MKMIFLIKIRQMTMNGNLVPAHPNNAGTILVEKKQLDLLPLLIIFFTGIILLQAFIFTLNANFKLLQL